MPRLIIAPTTGGSRRPGSAGRSRLAGTSRGQHAENALSPVAVCAWLPLDPYHPAHVWRLLGTLDWTLQRTATRAKERKEGLSALTPIGRSARNYNVGPPRSAKFNGARDNPFLLSVQREMTVSGSHHHVTPSAISRDRDPFDIKNKTQCSSLLQV